MGMSASQARFLCLTARKNNVEFEGQQINQQRTTLANESASYYSELCNMSVPVPPSIDDYTKVSYTFNDGAMTNNITSLLYYKDSENPLLPYRLNYLQQWQDDYSIVPASSSLVQKDGTAYSIADSTLRSLAGGTIPTAGTDVYYDSLTQEQKQQAMETEKYYKALLQDEGLGEDFYVRYIKNTTTGAYDPYFYEKTAVERASYNDRNLASVPCYTIGSTTKTKEVLNVECNVEQDQSGRYVALVFGGEEKTREVSKIVDYVQGEQINIGEKVPNPERTQWIENNPEPQKEDYFLGKVPVVQTKEVVDDQLAQEMVDIFMSSAKMCYTEALERGSRGCYQHVIAHLLELEIAGNDADRSKYPKYFQTTEGDTITIRAYDPEPFNIQIFNSFIQRDGNTPKLLPVSNYVSYGILGNKRVHLPVVAKLSDYDELGLSEEILDLLSDKYLREGNATKEQRLLSNYIVDENGEIVKKTLKQKAIDLYYLDSTVKDDYYYERVISRFLETFQVDMSHIDVYTIDETKYIDKYNEDEYNADHNEWQEELDKIPAEVDAEPVYARVPVYDTTTETYVDGAKRVTLLTTTITDEEAYNQAMNDYTYKISQYDHKVQEINSKLEIIQFQDKQLELKLKQLDTEENAISTEMDAVKKVISKNVDSSFRTFSA